jgi:excisionase family DNA binding protein
MPAHEAAAMTVRDVASVLSVDEKTVYRLVQSGRLPGFKVGGAWRFLRVDLDQWIAKQKQQSEVAHPRKTGSAGSPRPSNTIEIESAQPRGRASSASPDSQIRRASHLASSRKKK